VLLLRLLVTCREIRLEGLPLIPHHGEAARCSDASQTRQTMCELHECSE
jgi:hypothetical protein